MKRIQRIFKYWRIVGAILGILIFLNLFFVNKVYAGALDWLDPVANFKKAIREFLSELATDFATFAFEGMYTFDAVDISLFPFRVVTNRSQCATPIAIGELFNHLAAFSEAFSVKTAWHGPKDVSPVGHAANVHLDVSISNFDIQEWSGISEISEEVFPGCPQLKDGYVYPNEKPGLGIDIDEKKAALYPCESKLKTWTTARTPDGTAVRP